MRRLGVALAVTVTVAISGCAASPASTSGDGTASPDADDRATYLEHVKTTWSGEIPDEDVLLGYGDEVCRQLVDGEQLDDVEVLEDDDVPAADANTRSVVDAATLALCPTALDG